MQESAGSLPNGATDEADRPAGESRENMGPDPVIGAGIALFGIFIMGTSGAREAHYLFDVGVGIAILGAIIFTLFVTLSALKLRITQQQSSEPAPPAA